MDPADRYVLEPRELPCGKGDRLVIALERERHGGGWQAVYYQARFPGDPIGARFAIEKPILLDALRVIFAEAGAPFDADALVDYIAATTWGAPLPRLTAKRKPVPMPQDERLATAYGWAPGDGKAEP